MDLGPKCLGTQQNHCNHRPAAFSVLFKLSLMWPILPLTVTVDIAAFRW